MTPKRLETVKMMFQKENRHALQTLVHNITVSPEAQCALKSILDAIQITIKEGEHFWHYGNEILSDVYQKTDEPILLLSTCSSQLKNNCRFTNIYTKETLQLILLQHTIKYHEANDRIHQQHHSPLPTEPPNPLQDSRSPG